MASQVVCQVRYEAQKLIRIQMIGKLILSPLVNGTPFGPQGPGTLSEICSLNPLFC